ncbi:MAG: hypothetical protein QGG73_11415 [Candidatus Hydrogenedentes bacterium]|nr:hypothetical protein [Candidatus Hydrogenedentota bacterium]
MSKVILSFIPLLVLLCVCTGGCEGPKPPPTTSPALDGFAPPLAGTQGIGDIESALRFEILLSEASVADNIISDVKESKREFVVSATLNVGAPQPRELWLDATVRSRDDFPGHTVLIRPRMYVSGDAFERKAIPLDEVVMGNTARQDATVQKIDLLKHLDEIPESVLITGHLHIYYFKDTPLAEANLENLDSFPSEMHSRRTANTMRVNFNF